LQRCHGNGQFAPNAVDFSQPAAAAIQFDQSDYLPWPRIGQSTLFGGNQATKGRRMFKAVSAKRKGTRPAN
jgi:hypothetical protein